MTDAAAPKLFWCDVKDAGTEALVHCHGKLVAGVGSILYGEVSKLLPTHKRVVLDLTDVDYMDSLGLGTIIRLYVSAKSAGCSLELVNLGKRIRELLGVTNLLGVFTIIGENDIRI
jgi:anti-anti-sigma factor